MISTPQLGKAALCALAWLVILALVALFRYGYIVLTIIALALIFGAFTWWLLG